MSRFGSHLFIVRPHYCLHASNINCCSYVFSTFKRKVTGGSELFKDYESIVNSIKSKIDLSERAVPKEKTTLPADKITSFPLANKKKEIGYAKPKEGILNIDLLYNPFLKDKYASLPSVSKVLNDTMADTSRVALEKWKNSMIQKIGELKFNEYYAEQLKRGTNFHKAVKDHVMGKELRSFEKDTTLCFQSVEWVLKDLSDVAAVESCVVHPVLGYKGIVDCVGKYKNKPVLIEWKLSNKRKNGIKSTFDAPLQLSAYLGALNYDKNYNFQVDGGLIVVAYADGSPADLFQVPMEGCERFWTLWLNRLSSYASTFSPKILL